MATSNHFRDYAPREMVRDGPSAGRFLLVAAATLVLGVGIGIALYLMQATPPSTAVSDAVASATGRREAPPPKAAPAAAPAAVTSAVATRPRQNFDDGTWTDADLARCSEEAAAAAEIASKRKLAAVSSDRVGLGAPDPKMVERAALLLCSARSKPLHLCQPYWHDRLTEAIRSYAVDFRNVSASAYWTKVSLAERARADVTVSENDLRVMADDIDQTTREVAGMHQEIKTALRALVADGIVSLDEFAMFLGLGIPPEITALLGEGRALRHRCG